MNQNEPQIYERNTISNSNVHNTSSGSPAGKSCQRCQSRLRSK